MSASPKDGDIGGLLGTCRVSAPPCRETALNWARDALEIGERRTTVTLHQEMGRGNGEKGESDRVGEATACRTLRHRRDLRCCIDCCCEPAVFPGSGREETSGNRIGLRVKFSEFSWRESAALRSGHRYG